MGVPLSLIQSNQEGFIKEIFSNILKDKERWHDKKKQKKIHGFLFSHQDRIRTLQSEHICNYLRIELVIREQLGHILNELFSCYHQ